ncbi:hypothetical protein HMI51_35640 [Corallococcus coralloides]|nr:hypothetical protein [Corallococcus coralloides]
MNPSPRSNCAPFFATARTTLGERTVSGTSNTNRVSAASNSRALTGTLRSHVAGAYVRVPRSVRSRTVGPLAQPVSSTNNNIHTPALCAVMATSMRPKDNGAEGP